MLEDAGPWICRGKRLDRTQVPICNNHDFTGFDFAFKDGADNVESDAAGHEITCAVDDFSTVRDALEAKFGEAAEAKLQWRPLNTTVIEGDAADSLMKLIDALEDNDDVQNVYSNYEVSDETLQRLSA